MPLLFFDVMYDEYPDDDWEKIENAENSNLTGDEDDYGEESYP